VFALRLPTDGPETARRCSRPPGPAEAEAEAEDEAEAEEEEEEEEDEGGVALENVRLRRTPRRRALRIFAEEAEEMGGRWLVEDEGENVRLGDAEVKGTMLFRTLSVLGQNNSERALVLEESALDW